MKMYLVTTLVSVSVCGLTGCTTPPKLSECASVHEYNYLRQYGGTPAAALRVVNSLPHEPRGGEFELYAPTLWVEAEKQRLHLRGPVSRARAWQTIRPQARWFAPGNRDVYEVWECYMTSIPYTHMIVDTNATEDGSIHLYMITM